MAKFYSGPWTRVTIAQAGTDSGDFELPTGAKTLQIHIPILEAGTTVALQANVPKEQENVTDAWTGVTVFDLTDGTFEALDGMGSTSATIVVIPVSATGPGPLRFVASGAQTTAARVIHVAYGMDG